MCIWFEINSIYCQRNFEVMLIESFSTIQCQIELVNNSKTEMEMSAPLLQQVFQSIHFSIHNWNLWKILSATDMLTAHPRYFSDWNCFPHFFFKICGTFVVVLFKSTTILKEMRIAQLFSQNERILPVKNYLIFIMLDH